MADVTSDLSFPAFRTAATFEVKINSSGSFNYPAFNVVSQMIVVNTINGATIYPEYGFHALSGVVEVDGDNTFPAFGIAAEADVAYGADLAVVLHIVESSNDCDTMPSRRSYCIVG